MNLGPVAKYLVGVLDAMKIYSNLLCDLFFIGVFDLKICITWDLCVLWKTRCFNGQNQVLIKENLEMLVFFCFC